PHGAAGRHPYSIACSPERAAETHALELLIAMEGGSGDLTWAASGALVDLEGPIGTFTFPASLDQSRLLFVAGGTGIAPVRAMLDHALRRHPAEEISLLYSTRSRDEFAFMEEFRAHERSGRLELHPTVTRDEALVGVDVDVRAADVRVVEHRGLDTCRDRRVVDRFADRLAAARDERRRQQRRQQRHLPTAELLHRALRGGRCKLHSGDVEP